MKTIHLHFPTFLRYLLEYKFYQISKIAQASGVHAPDISKMASGERVVGPKVFSKLIKGIREEDRADSLAAWLKDQIPEGAEDFVHIVKAESLVVREDETSRPHNVEGALKLLAKHAERVPALRDVIISLAASYGPVAR